MSDRRPIEAATELRRAISAVDTEIPVISTNPFVVDSRKQVGDEFVRCAAFTTDAQGWPVMTGCERGVSREDGGTEPRGWPGGTPVLEVDWTSVEIVTEIPTPTLAMVGRQFVYRDPNGNVYSFNVVTSPMGEPIIEWLDKPPEDLRPLLEWAFLTLVEPEGVAVDVDENVYYATPNQGFVGATDLGFVRKHSPDGTLLQSFGGSLDPFVPYGVEVDGSKNVYVSCGDGDAASTKIMKFSPAGTQLWSVGTYGTGDGEYIWPIDLTLDAAGKVWVIDADTPRAQRLNPTTGAYEWQFAIDYDSVNTPSIRAVAIDLDGNFWFGDVANAKVIKTSPTGTVLLVLGSDDVREPGNFSAPTGIDVDAKNRIWVADAGANYRVQILDTAGRFLGQTSNPHNNSSPSGVWSPISVGIGPSNVGYIADRPPFSSQDHISRVWLPSFDTPIMTSMPIDGEVLTYDAGLGAWVNGPGPGLTFIDGDTFSAVAAVNVDGKLDATYENYLLLVTITAESAAADIIMRLRAAGIDAATNYDVGLHYVASNNTSAALGAAAQLHWTLARVLAAAANDIGIAATLFRPAVADQTHMSSRAVALRTDNIVIHGDNGGSHRDATAYDGFSLLPNVPANLSGSWALYGYAS